MKCELKLVSFWKEMSSIDKRYLCGNYTRAPEYTVKEEEAKKTETETEMKDKQDEEEEK